MTEQEWFLCNDPTPMLEFVRGKASERKLRLFAVACCRSLMRKVRVSPMREHEVNLAERYADGAVSVGDLATARCYSSSPIAKEFSLFDAVRTHSKDAEAACQNAAETAGGVIMADCAAGNAAWAVAKEGAEPPHDNSLSPLFNARLAIEQGSQCGLLRDIFGNPFRPAFIDPAWCRWHGGTISKLAQDIYEDQAFDQLPVLADALEEAGGTNADILNHCRQPGPHVRGCWVVDTVLEKV